MLFRLWESVELLSNHFWHLFLSRIDGEINGFAWGLEVNNGVSERELLLCFECAEVRKKGAGWFITVGKERERYIYPLSPNGHLNHR